MPEQNKHSSDWAYRNALGLPTFLAITCDVKLVQYVVCFVLHVPAHGGPVWPTIRTGNNSLRNTWMHTMEHCAAILKAAGSIPDGVTGIVH
jgi:hypothetical protein